MYLAVAVVDGAGGAAGLRVTSYHGQRLQRQLVTRQMS